MPAATMRKAKPGVNAKLVERRKARDRIARMAAWTATGISLGFLLSILFTLFRLGFSGLSLDRSCNRHSAPRSAHRSG